MAEDNGGPAFPGTQTDPELRERLLADKTAGIGRYEAERMTQYRGGMSLRDWFAGQALAGILHAGIPSDKAACDAYAAKVGMLADAMLTERAK